MQSRSSELLNNMLVQIKLRSLLAQTKLRFFQVCVCVCVSRVSKPRLRGSRLLHSLAQELILINNPNATLLTVVART